MKYIVVVLLLTILASTNCKLKHEALRAAIGKFLKASFDHTTDCITTTGTSDEVVIKYWNHEYNAESDQPLKCYLRCAFLKTGIVDEGGTLLIDNLMNKNGVVHQIVSHNPQIIIKLDEFCKNPLSPEGCEAAYLLTECAFHWIMIVS